MTIHLRRATPADLPAIIETDGRSFGQHHTQEDQDDIRLLIDPARFLLACDDDTVAGVAGSFAFDVTLPGGASLPVPGVSWVGVLATHRRRGVLRTLFTELHRGFVADGAALALLTASEAGIYGRFGYGPTTVDRGVEIDRRRTEFRPGVPDPGGVRFIDTETARKHAPAIHRRWCAVTPGAVSRFDGLWDVHMRDADRHRGGASALFHLAHPDGYASFRRRDDQGCEVEDLFAATEEARIALWRVILSLDLVRTITTRRAVAIDDPLPLLLTDPRVVRTTGANDGLWVRVLDAAAALGSRTYAVELDVVLAVDHDPFLERGGRFRLRGGPEGATCEPTDAAPDLRIATAALGPLLFGGARAVTLARAGLLGGATPEVLRRVDAAFLSDRAPQHGTGF